MAPSLCLTPILSLPSAHPRALVSASPSPNSFSLVHSQPPNARPNAPPDAPLNAPPNVPPNAPLWLPLMLLLMLILIFLIFLLVAPYSSS